MADKTQVNIARMKAYDKVLNFEEAKHKRDKNGRFTSGGSNSTTLKAPESPLMKAAKAIAKPISQKENENLSINKTSNMMATVESELKRFDEDPDYHRKTNSTQQGLKWAKEFLGTRGENLSESELKHAIRLTRFRGRNKPEYLGN